MTMNSQTLSFLALMALLPACPAGPEPFRMEVLPSEWQLAGFENSLDLSGLASAGGTQVLVGSDESFYIQPGEVDAGRRRIESRRPVALPLQKAAKGKKAEVDIEGVAFSPDERAYYVVGSHGVGKKKGDFQADRHSIYRIPVGTDGKVMEDKIRRASLLPWLERTPLLQPHVKQPLQQNGLNIEGLTWSRGKLYFGLRAPNKDGRAVVIEASPIEIFSGKPKQLELHEIVVPRGRGIREIAAVRDGFLILTGNASAEASRKIPISQAPGPDNHFKLLHWSGGGASATKLGTLLPNGGKAEALLVMKDEAAHADVLVIFDGLPGGGPLEVRIHR